MSQHSHTWVVVRKDVFSDLIVRVFLCTRCFKRRAESTSKRADNGYSVKLESDSE